MKARSVKKLDPALPLAENAARIVAVRLDEMRALAIDALAPPQAEAQHDMRIAAKRLRYILETTGFCFGREAKTAVRSARRLQDVLGALHDCDVMLPLVEEHLHELRVADAEAVRRSAAHADDLDPRLVARAPNRTTYRGLELLAVYVQARRDLLFEKFQALWKEQEVAGTWERLERLVTRRLHEAREHRRNSERVERAASKLREAELDERSAADRAARAATELEAARRQESSQRAVWLPRNGAGAAGGAPRQTRRRGSRLAAS